MSCSVGLDCAGHCCPPDLWLIGGHCCPLGLLVDWRALLPAWFVGL